MDRFFRFGYKFCVFFLGFTFFTAGMGKLYDGHNYIGFMGPVWLTERLAEYDLGLYAQFIGLSQVIIGFSLLTWRFRKLASIMLIPMILNILMVTISMNWKGTPYVVAVFLLMNLFVIGFDQKEYLHLIGVPSKISPKAYSMNASMIWLLGVFLVVGSIGFSFIHLISSWIISIVALGISSYSNWMEKSYE